MVEPRPLHWCWLGRVPYEPALELQLALARERESGGGRDVLLLLEHDPVFTAGRRASAEELIWDERDRAARGIGYVETDRGGKLTYHGPGQLVGYPIVHIEERGLGVRSWVRTIEHALIDYLRPFGIEGAIDCAAPGVWVGTGKIAAIGLHITRGVSRHGFALNLAPDMSHFAGIVACGISDRGITSIAGMRGVAPTTAEAAEHVAQALAARLGVEAIGLSPEELPVPASGPAARRSA